MILNLQPAIQDVREALFQGQFQFAESILKRLFEGTESAREITARQLEKAARDRWKKFHPWHLHTAVDPFLAFLHAHPEAIPETSVQGSRLQILAQAVIQNGSEGSDGLIPLREVVEDLYDGFLSDDFRERIKGPMRGSGLMPPLVEWTLAPDMRPFTLDERRLKKLGVHCGVIGMPRSFSRGGLLVWASLAHEVCGHAVLNAYPGALDPVRAEVNAALKRRFAAGPAAQLPEYWDRCFEEAAADCLGILRLGPAMAVGFIGAFRSGRAFLAERNGAASLSPGLGREDYDRHHPSDLFRALLMTSLCGRLAFRKRQEWKRILMAEIAKDFGPAAPGGIPWEDVRESTEIFAGSFLDTPMESFSGLSMGRLRNWSDWDEATAAATQSLIAMERREASAQRPTGLHATHALAAAILLAASDGNRIRIPVLFRRLMSLLKSIHAEKRPAPSPIVPVRARLKPERSGPCSTRTDPNRKKNGKRHRHHSSCRQIKE
ncbi:MAG TPA: hypothetical protein VJ385_04480 [Fibrobacteria bacterium]|nr:hypothetical protein [Fibrobacteria bacterium]